MERELTLYCLFLWGLILSDQGPTLITSFDLSYLLKRMFPDLSMLGVERFTANLFWSNASLPFSLLELSLEVSWQDALNGQTSSALCKMLTWGKKAWMSVLALLANLCVWGSVLVQLCCLLSHFLNGIFVCWLCSYTLDSFVLPSTLLVSLSCFSSSYP